MTCVLAAALILTAAACGAQSVASSDAPLAQRVAALPAEQRAPWVEYLERSARLQQRDRDTIAAELRALGRQRMVPAPNARTSFTVQRYMTDAWFRTDSARQLAEAILSYQTPSGGWSKHVDFAAGPRPAGTSFFAENDGWNFIATFDNNSTTEQLRFLGRVAAVVPDQRYLDAMRRGVEFLLDAQYPNGCWPQVYPLMGGYHDAATFNDDATVNVLAVLRDVALYEPTLPGVEPTQRGRANLAVTRGVECILASQVVVARKRTIWGQQHDPLTLAPVRARSYEHPSLASRESAGIVAFLMEFPDPVPRVTVAVRSAIDWFRENQLRGLTYDVRSGVVEQAGAIGWARMSEIGTNRPIYSNRDGMILYDYRKLTDRKTGYLWISNEPADVLKKYERWAARHGAAEAAATRHPTPGPARDTQNPAPDTQNPAPDTRHQAPGPSL